MPTYTEPQVPYLGESGTRPPIKSRPRSWKFRYWALRNWLDGYAFSAIKRCRTCDHTTPYHYPKCIRGVSRIEFEQGMK